MGDFGYSLWTLEFATFHNFCRDVGSCKHVIGALCFHRFVRIHYCWAMAPEYCRPAEFHSHSLSITFILWEVYLITLTPFLTSVLPTDLFFAHGNHFTEPDVRIKTKVMKLERCVTGNQYLQQIDYSMFSLLKFCAFYTLKVMGLVCWTLISASKIQVWWSDHH